jgi:gamma-glutamylcyclotransferase (GGCT)/AIG2-like uncharacterized protein YtfP
MFIKVLRVLVTRIKQSREERDMDTNTTETTGGKPKGPFARGLTSTKEHPALWTAIFILLAMVIVLGTSTYNLNRLYYQSNGEMDDLKKAHEIALSAADKENNRLKEELRTVQDANDRLGGQVAALIADKKKLSGELASVKAKLAKLDAVKKVKHRHAAKKMKRPSGAAWRYQVRWGDTPSELAVRFLGDYDLGPAILEVNKKKEAQSLQAGQYIWIPTCKKAEKVVAGLGNRPIADVSSAKKKNVSASRDGAKQKEVRASTSPSQLTGLASTKTALPEAAAGVVRHEDSGAAPVRTADAKQSGRGEGLSWADIFGGYTAASDKELARVHAQGSPFFLALDGSAYERFDPTKWVAMKLGLRSGAGETGPPR